MSNNKIVKISASGVYDQTTADCNQLLSEIQITYIPANFIDGMSLTYTDGTRINLACEFTKPLDLTDPTIWSTFERPTRQLRDIKIYINPEKLDDEVNKVVDRLFSKHFT